jgi:hypothetical protein
VRSHVKAYLEKGRNEDWFYTQYAGHYAPGFNLAPPDRALEFGFEVEPRRCFELNGYRMPFGCHAWEKYDRAFWEPHLLTREGMEHTLLHENDD